MGEGRPGRAVAMVGDRASGEVESTARPGQDYLDARRVAVDSFGSDRRRQCCHRGAGVVFQERDNPVERGAGDLGLVALEVDDDPRAVQGGGHLGDAVSAAGVVDTGHHAFTAESRHRRGDPRVVGRDDHPVEPPGPPRGLDDVLDQGSARLGQEGFAGQSG